MNPYHDFVQGIETGFQQAKELSASGKAPLTESNSKVLLFSPHPDDECITGLLPLRLMRETGRQIINIPVTFGSNVQRQAARASELENACGAGPGNRQHAINALPGTGSHAPAGATGFQPCNDL